WIQHWLPQLTISAEYISANEVWMMLDEGKPIAFYALCSTVIASLEEAKQSPTETSRLLRREEHTPRNDMELGHLWVLPEYIGKGIGKQLLGHALERCKLLNISSLKIYADPNAQTFYEKMGAKKIGESKSDLFGQERILPLMEIHL
ncbi:MAG: GNAT family N-acetyltransferase, partial [Anaerolineales bacterium]|nr:GNAT family N-acetyltransferase [Anaerolineales bacterium]